LPGLIWGIAEGVRASGPWGQLWTGKPKRHWGERMRLFAWDKPGGTLCFIGTPLPPPPGPRIRPVQSSLPAKALRIRPHPKPQAPALDDVRISHQNRPKNKLDQLLANYQNTSSDKKQMQQESFAQDSNNKNGPPENRTMLLQQTPQGQTSYSKPKFLDQSFQKLFEKNLNSDQKLFLDKFDDFGINMAEPGILEAEVAFRQEDNLGFSEEGNSHEKRMHYSKKFFESDLDQTHLDKQYRENFTSLMDTRQVVPDDDNDSEDPLDIVERLNLSKRRLEEGGLYDSRRK